MESKGRRAGRAATPVIPAESVDSTAALPGAGTAVADQAEEFNPVAEAEEFILVAAPVEVPASVGIALAAPSVDAPATAAKNASGEEFAEFGREVFAAFVQSQTAAARGLEALSAEVTAMALSGIDAATRTATDMLGVKTLADAIEVNAGLTHSGFDTLVSGSAKLSELGMKLATEVSQPILTQLGRSWTKAARRGF
jgi:hypothetical protein